MPGKTKHVKPAVEKMTELVQFPLLPSEVEEVRSWILTAETIMSDVQDLTNKGFRFDIMLNNNGTGYSVLVKYSDSRLVNAGLGYYCNAPSLLQALAIAIFKIRLLGSKASTDFLSSRNVERELS